MICDVFFVHWKDMFYIKIDDENSTSSSTYLSYCEYYTIQNYIDKTLSITVQFLSESVFNFQRLVVFKVQ